MGLGFFEEGRPALLDSLILRLVTASLVATWSPGHFCCCQGQTAEAVEALSGAWAASVDMGEADSGCCSPAPAAPLDMTLDRGCGGGCETKGPADRDSCGCIDMPTDTIPPTVGAVPAGGKQLGDTIDLLAAAERLLRRSNGGGDPVGAAHQDVEAGNIAAGVTASPQRTQVKA